MKLSRRDFLKLGGATLIVVAGGSVFRAVDQGVFSVGQGIAYGPWTNWRDAKNPIERIVAASILASNPHNSQPWLFRITDSTIDLFAVPERQIGVIDPFRREMYIGLGCAIENMRLAAKAEGFKADIRLMPDPTTELHAASISLAESAAATSPSTHPLVAGQALYEAIPHRHTDRAAYDTTRSVDQAAFSGIESLVTESTVRLIWMRGSSSHKKFGEVAIATAEALIADDQQSMDSHKWWRQDWDDVQSHADGITLDAQGMPLVILNAAKILPDMSRPSNDQAFVKNIRDTVILTAAAFGILAVPNGLDFSNRLQCGQIWQRIQLWATTQNLAMQPLNQMTERADREAQLGIEPVFGKAIAELIGDENWTGIMPFRMGYPTETGLPSPRRGLDKVIA